MKPSDTEVVDCIATLLGTAEEWSSAADFFDDIATLISRVRPHPGNSSPDDYALAFKAATGRDVSGSWDQREASPVE